MNKSERKRNNRRMVLAGYPSDVVFSIPEQLDAYFSAVRLTCLECGQQKRSLGSHVLMHGITAEDYKAKHGIPWVRGLTGEETREMNIANGKQRMADGVVKPMSADALRAAVSGAKHRKRQPVRDALSMRNIEVMNAGKSGETSRARKERAERIAVEGKGNVGEKNNFAKLTNTAADQVRSAALAAEQTQRAIAREFGVSQPLVSSIKLGKVRRKAQA